MAERWDGDAYQRRFDALASAGHDVHGEAQFVMGLQPTSVLDAGCGTGRVAIELARRGIDVVGVDVDASMLAEAVERAPELQWVQSDLAQLNLGRRFSVVVMAGNVLLFTAPGTNGAIVASCARHLGFGGSLVAGFDFSRSYTLAMYDADCRAAGLQLSERFSTWNAHPFVGDGEYAVSIHVRT